MCKKCLPYRIVFVCNLTSFSSKVDFFVNGYFGQGEVKKARSSLSNEF